MEIKTKQKIYSILLMLISASCICLGQLIWKLMPDYNIIYVLGGLAVYGFGGIALILAYRYGEVSVLQPINSMSYVFAAILGYLVLQEAIPLINIIGIFLIMSGVITIGLKQ